MQHLHARRRGGLTAYQVQSHGKLFNRPYHVRVSQLEKVIVKYMNDHPTELHVATSQLILWALIDAYPVPKK